MAKALEWEIQPDEAEFSPFSSSGRAVKATLTSWAETGKGTLSLSEEVTVQCGVKDSRC